MHDLSLGSLKGTLLVAVPFIALLALSFFRLDAIFGASKSAGPPRRPPCGMDENGKPLVVDPDGKVFEKALKRQ